MSAIIVIGLVCVVSLLTAVAALAFCAWMIVRIYTSHEPTKVAATIAKQIEETVRGRVQIANRLLHPGNPSSENLGPIEEAPLPPFMQTGFVDDDHEIQRELKRYRNPDRDKQQSIRDIGIGVDMA